MWMEIDRQNAPEPLAAATSAIWQYDDVARIGFMRGTTFLVPPYIWAEVYRSSFALLRRGGKILDDLQRMVYAPVVMAETDSDKNADLLLVLGFDRIGEQHDRQLFQRSVG